MRAGLRYRLIGVLTLCVMGLGAWSLSGRLWSSSDCVKRGDCRPSYRNTDVCETLAPGLDEAALARRLGEPTAAQGASRFYQAGAQERGPIEVVLDVHARAAEFHCHGRSAAR